MGTEQGRALPALAILAMLEVLAAAGLAASEVPGFARIGWIATVLGLVVLGLAGWALAARLEPPSARPLARAAWLVVLVHLGLVLAHGAAHEALGVELGPLQLAYALVVIVVAPLGAALLLFAARLRAGFALLAAAMSGALLFGLYWHYVAISPDHVAHLPPGEGRGLFRATALLLPVSEALGAALGFRGLARPRRAVPGT